MNIIIAGSRDYNNYEVLLKAIRIAIEDYGFKIDTIISGGAKGVDSLGERFAKTYNFNLKIFPADWNTYGNRAGYVRNSEMAKNADALIAVWNGKSRGTRMMIDIAKRNKLKVYVYYV